MATALDEMQFELLPSESANAGIAFGIGLDVSVYDGGFDPGEFGWVTQDGVDPNRGTTLFGRDVNTGTTWAWSLHVNTEDTQEALAALGRLSTAWKVGKRLAPGAVVALRYRVGDRVRRVYGRPRRFAAPPSNLIMSGLIPISADFAVSDDLTYDDVEQSTVISWATDSTGGFTLPATLPITTQPGGQREGAIYVSGDEEAYPVITFTGPITNPYLEHDDWKVSLDLTLTAGESATIDTRPWKLTAKKGSASVAGALGKRQWLTDVRLPVGNNDLRFGGASSSGGATCTVSWRSAWNSL